MGAGGSTAASCTSLEVAGGVKRSGGRHNKGLHLRHHQLLLDEDQLRMQARYSKKQQYMLASHSNGKSANMKQYSSHFDLTNDQLLLNHADCRADLVAKLAHNNGGVNLRTQQHQTADGCWFDTGQSEAGGYSLSGANIGVVRPLMVLPSEAPVSPLLNSNHHRLHDQVPQVSAKKVSANGPTATKIHHRQQQLQNRSNDLCKFSDSLPSLNNIVGNIGSDRLSPSRMNMSPIRIRCNRPSSPCRYEHRGLAGMHHDHQNHIRYSKMQLSPSLAKPHPYSVHKQTHLPNCHGPQTASSQAIKRATSLSTLHDRHFSEDQANLQSYQFDMLDKNCSQHKHQHKQPTSVAKKIFKFKQVGSQQEGGYITSGAKKYKRKQKQAVAPQQGCQVLPPLPRSQSLHELIQLRATENGQRMRTTGTLRTNATTGTESGNKVNLVAEILESRRQQRHEIDDPQSGQMAAAESILSRSSSSTDDGIHDISLSGGHSTTDSRQEKAQAPSGKHEGQPERIFKKKNSQMLQSRERGARSPHIYPSRPNSQAMMAESARAQPISMSNVCGKSTLKRSLSHSALHQNSSALNNLDGDQDESDDLSELAKFLYQFKQRQNAQAAQSKQLESGKINRNLDKHHLNVTASSSQGFNSAGKPPLGGSEKLQQSPTSTTSSSGFASSSCASNSISSADSRNNQQVEHLHRKNAASPRKKYPAPARPDVALKSASSLMFMVDDSKITVESTGAVSSGSRQVNLSPDSNHLEQLKRYTQLRQMSQSELALNHLISSTHLSDSQQQGSRRALGEVANGSKRNLSAEQSSQPVTRAVSKPYKSKLISLIRRISDKPSDGNSMNSSTSAGSKDRTSNKLSASENSVGGLDASSESYKRRAINHSKSIVPQAKCQSGKRVDLDRSGKSEPTLALLDGRCDRRGGLSESVRDLNFDCDFELVKNCGSSNNSSPLVVGSQIEDGKQVVSSSAKVGPSSSLLAPLSNQALISSARGEPNQYPLRNGLRSPTTNTTTTSTTCCLSAASAESRQVADGGGLVASDKQRSTPINSHSSGENNWRLVASSNSAYQAHQNRQAACQSAGEPDEARRPSAGKTVAPRPPPLPTPTKASRPNKLKWSASNWLINGRDSNNSAKQKEKQVAGNSSGKSYLSKLISTSRTSAGVASDVQPVNRKVNHVELSDEEKRNALMSNEASQLLDELDQSLDLQSSGSSSIFAEKQLAWWSQAKPAGSLKGSNGSGDDDPEADYGAHVEARRYQQQQQYGSYSDEDDDGQETDDYATINKAIINATFDADILADQRLKQLQLQHQQEAPPQQPVGAASPSDSFTFSAPPSPEPFVESQGSPEKVDAKSETTVGLEGSSADAIRKCQNKPGVSESCTDLANSMVGGIGTELKSSPKRDPCNRPANRFTSGCNQTADESVKRRDEQWLPANDARSCKMIDKHTGNGFISEHKQPVPMRC